MTWYGGEPLLGLNVIQSILDGLSKRNIHLNRHTIVTNGFLFNSKAISLFEKHPLDGIQITLDGVASRHDRLRCLKVTHAPTFDTIVNNIQNIAQTFPNTKIDVRVNIDKNNTNDYFILERDINNLIRSNNLTVYPGIIRLENEEKTNIVEPAFGRWETAQFLYDLYSNGILRGDSYPSVRRSKTCCASCVNSFIIGPEGEIYKCWNDVSDESKVVGHIQNNKIENKTLYNRYHIGCAWYNDAECRKCFFLPICNGKCAWYNELNLYHQGHFNLCQCLQKAPGLLDKCLEDYYNKINLK